MPVRTGQPLRIQLGEERWRGPELFFDPGAFTKGDMACMGRAPTPHVFVTLHRARVRWLTPAQLLVCRHGSHSQGPHLPSWHSRPPDATPSLPDLIDDAIQACPIDTRRALYGNIVLSVRGPILSGDDCILLTS